MAKRCKDATAAATAAAPAEMLAGICFLKQAPHNKIRRLGTLEALPNILMQTLHGMQEVQYTQNLLGYLDDLLAKIPVYELENLPEPAAAQLSYETMLQGRNL